MKWVKAHKLFSSIMGVVLGLCLLLVFSYSTVGGSTIIGKGVQKTTSFISKPMTTISTGLNNFFTGVFSYGDLEKRNDELQERVDELEKENTELKLTKDELAQLEDLAKAFDFSPYQGGAKAVAGEVIEIDYSKPYVVFTIDVGTEKGIKKDCVVTDGNGLVGKVYETGKGWSKIVSVASEGNNISFKVMRKTSITGIVKGDGEKGLEGYLLNANDRIVKDDVLVTTGIGVYPEGIKIGKVKSVEYDEDRQQRVITVEPTCNLSGLQKVAVFL